jgi:predicted hydrolase (HD superfamily)
MSDIPSRREAEALARRFLEPLGDRWRHTQAVAARAADLSAGVPTSDRDILVVAAWLHDLGYAPPIAASRFHPLDGARYLSREGYSPRLCALVAHHSAATCEATERGLLDELCAWPQEEGPVPDALWMADMTTGPTGELVDYPSRLAEILSRYEADSVVGRAMSNARPVIQQAIARTRERLDRANSAPS